jgi:DNA primase
LAFIGDDKVEEIRQRADIFEVISSHTQLKRAGRNYVGLCPFHQEKTPSFHVNTERQIFKCFGCQKGGDVIRFIMDVHGVTFPEALRQLADRYAIELPYQAGGQEGRGTREIILDLNGKAAQFYQSMLVDMERGSVAREYLDRRGVLDVMTHRFGLGWAPDSWDALYNEFRKTGVDIEKASQAGLLVKKTGGGLYDRFRGRLMFPIRNTAGKTIGFSGRILTGDDQAKYINSTESEIFNKSNSFYGIDLAIDAIRKSGRAILCEGNLDVIMLHQYGFPEALASLGTALTDSHVRRLVRSSDNVFIIFDGDEAGQKAMRRALELFLPLDVQPRCVVLPDGNDPDSYLRSEGAQALQNLIGQAPTLIEFAVDRSLRMHPQDNEGRAKAVVEIIPVLSHIGNAVLQDLWIKTVAEKAGVGSDALRRQMMAAKRPRPTEASPDKSRPEANKSLKTDPEVGLTRLLINYPRYALQFAQEDIAALFTNPSLKMLAEKISETAINSQASEDFSLSSIVGHIEDAALQDEVAGWALDDGGIGEGQSALAYKDFSRKIKAAGLKRRLDEIDRTIKNTAQSDDEMKRSLLLEKQKIKSRLDSDLNDGY